ncbi:MAG: SEC-C metal-binding domain-containing protein [Candidatus Latescibacterota bacterium]
MARMKLSRNAPCPCGSGRKYKHCCYGKGVEWNEDEAGTITKSVPLSAEAMEVLEQQRREFLARFGREPGRGDPIFFDTPPVEHIEFQVAQAMKEAGIHPALIYAFEKTGGLLVTQQNMHLIPEADLDAWQAAVDEYKALHASRPPEPP